MTQSFAQSFLTVDFKSTHLACLGIIPPKEVSFLASWKAGSLPTTLVEGNPGLLGPKYRLPNRLTRQCQPAIPHCPHYSAEQMHLISEEITGLL